METKEDLDGNKIIKKYRNGYIPKLRERCDTIVGTANYLSPEVINQAFPGAIVEPIAVKRGRGRPKKNES